ncbi:MAG: PAS domain S-box protein [Ferruginibacter sp.]
MKRDQYFGVIKYTLTGIIIGILMVLIGGVLTHLQDFKTTWFTSNFTLALFPPVFLGVVFCFIGFKREKLLSINQQLQAALSGEQEINSASGKHLQLLGSVIEQVDEAIVISGKSGQVEWINNGFTKTNGYTLEEIKGKYINNVLHGPLTDKEAANKMIDTLVSGQAVEQELLTYHKNGQPLWLSLSIKPICDDAGAVVNFVAIQKNVTTRKEKEISTEPLYRTLADYKFALDQYAIVSIFNTNGKIVRANKKFCELNDISEEELLGKDYSSISVGMRDKGIVEPIWDTLFSGNTWKGELINRNKDGKNYWADTTIVPLLDDDRKPYQFLAIQQDITERKELEHQLITNKNKLQEVMQVAGLGSWEIDSQGVLTLSKELMDILGLSPGHPPSRHEILSHLHHDDFVQMRDMMQLCRIGLQRTEVEYRYVKNGKVQYMVSNINPRLDDDGCFIGSFGTAQDITASKLQAIALKKSREEMAVIFNHTQTIICLHDMQGVLLDINAAAEKTSGFSKEEVIGLNLKLIVSPGYHAEYDEYIQTINKNPTATGTMQIFTKSGVKRVWLYQNTVYENDGNPYVIASAVDITELVKTQNEIEKQQQFIRQIIDNSPNVIFVMNEQRQIVLANKTFGQYYRYSEKDQPLASSLSTGPDDIFLGDVESIFEMEDGEMIRLEGSLRNPTTDSMSWFSIIDKCFKERSGKKYILVFGMDITGRYHVETELISANEIVERSLKVKDQFIANMSHEIRTPLNAVMGFTDLLAGTKLDKEQTEFVDIVKTASANLLALVNNVLDLSKIESKQLSLESLPIDVKKIVSDVVQILEPKAKAKGLEIRTGFDTKLTGKVLGDQLRLTQVMFNLLGNAIKFTDTGTIDIIYKVVSGGDKTKEYIAFSIIDTGIGVPEDKQSDIFGRFTQANTDTQRLYGGTGLGLNISKSIVDLHGGVLSMESKPGKGTSFNFILPFKKYKEPENPGATKSTSAEVKALTTYGPLHILLAEDNLINAMLAKQVLTKKGFTIVHVLNGELAVEEVQKQHFDLVLMDIQMPVMNGIIATKTIRQLKGKVGLIPIVAMTAHSLNGEVQNCYTAGMNGYVAKPFKTDDLVSAIIEAVKKEETSMKE